ncbi:MAG: cobyrinate a,c-diamide synthase [Syntrophales bacterium]|nr:cobyrinate a,c-diamide synthase [Syntrophales bacterium]MDD5233881.1 cobyrinate a,c-diamide synthase [Syntrophales bacterium]MDD5531477.1 cobyrinate a,c-diamide synthase [Syntrophales bacterium]
MESPRIVIAGTQSGVGKTSLALALVAALKRRGLTVQTFKAGPDFLDPSYHAVASGRPCYNLDGWMMGKDHVLNLFARASRNADISIIEGVMGLFDGADPAGSEGSTAEIARWLKAPVLLIADAHGMARSLAALVRGYAGFEKGIRIAGVIANRTGSERHAEWLAQSLAAASAPPLSVSIPKGFLPALSSRHLGLVTADAETLPRIKLEALAEALEKRADLEGIIRIARGAPPLRFPDVPSGTGAYRKIRLAVARDRAFHFYYQDLFDALEERGCEIRFFSPLADPALPGRANGLYIGGGYPEECAEELAGNVSMKKSILTFAGSGKPVYAECGGLMYLCRSIETADGRKHPMTGVIPAQAKMLSRRKMLGYVEVNLNDDSLWGARGQALRGHEFHYSEISSGPENGWRCVYDVKRRRSEEPVREGFQRGRVLASYSHLHFASRPAAVDRFVDVCGKAGAGGQP